MVFAVIWHFWIGLFLALGAAVIVPAVATGYLRKVVRPRYPTREQRLAQDQAPPG